MKKVKNLFTSIKRNKHRLLIVLISFLLSFSFFSEYKAIKQTAVNFLRPTFEYQKKFSIVLNNLKSFWNYLLNLSNNIYSYFSQDPIEKTKEYITNINFSLSDNIIIIINFTMIICIYIYLKYSKRHKTIKETRFLIFYKKVKLSVIKLLLRAKKILLFIKKERKTAFLSILFLILPFAVNISLHVLKYFLWYVIYMLMSSQMYQLHLLGGVFYILYLIADLFLFLPIIIRIVVVLLVLHLIIMYLAQKKHLQVHEKNKNKMDTVPFNQPFGIISGAMASGKTTLGTYLTLVQENIYLEEIEQKLVYFESQLDPKYCLELIDILNDNLALFLENLRLRELVLHMDKKNPKYKEIKAQAKVSCDAVLETSLKVIYDNRLYYDYLEYYYYHNIRKSCIISSYPIYDLNFGCFSKKLSVKNLDLTKKENQNIIEKYMILIVDETSKTLNMQAKQKDSQKFFMENHLDILVSMFSQACGRTGKMFFIDQKLTDINITARSNASYMLNIPEPISLYEPILIKLYLLPFKILDSISYKLLLFFSRSKHKHYKYTELAKFEISNKQINILEYITYKLYLLCERVIKNIHTKYCYLRLKKIYGLKETTNGQEKDSRLKALKIPLADISTEKLEPIFDTAYSRNFYIKNDLLVNVKSWNNILPTFEELKASGLYSKFFTEEKKANKKGEQKHEKHEKK